MISTDQLLSKFGDTLHENSPAIFAGIGVSGVLSTAYLSGVASFRAAQFLDVETENLPTLDKAKLVWKLYIPAATSGAIAIGCIIASTRIGAKRAAAAYSLLSVSERTLRDYRDKVVDHIGPRKEEKIRDEIAQDRAREGDSTVVVVGTGKVLCLELHSGRYFESSMEELKRAVNEVNREALNSDFARLDDFYYEVGLPTTTSSGHVGWYNHTSMDLRFSSVLTPDGRPVLAFDYNYIKPL